MHTITLCGEVGGEAFNLDQVKQLPGEPVHIIVNSGGGNVVTGFAIAALLASHAHQVTTEIVHAGSAAVPVALAGSHRTIHGGSSFFLHNCSGAVIGTWLAMLEAAEVMKAQDEAYATVIAERTGQDLKTILQLMQKETSITAHKAISLGFAHQILGPISEPPSQRPDPMKAAITAIAVQERTAAPEGAKQLQQAMPAALSLPSVAKAFSGPNHAPPEIAPDEAAAALDRFVEGQRRESEIRLKLGRKIQQMRNQGGIASWPTRTTWTCGECHATNYHPPHHRRFATGCRVCGHPTPPEEIS